MAQSAMPERWLIEIVTALRDSVNRRAAINTLNQLFAASRDTPRLLAAAETALAARGCVRLQLQLGDDNRAARAFYERRGYGPRAGYYLLDKPLP